MTSKLRNNAIIAHVDHGKTTLVDALLAQSGSLNQRDAAPERVMDSNDLERERGITILAKNTSLNWRGYTINIIDTPGHADFGGEVERVLSMADSVLLLVDAVEGPMPQTRFVTSKAFAMGLKPIVVINKIDRVGSRTDWVIDQTFDLFDRLGASEEQLDFTVVYTSAINGYATLDLALQKNSMDDLFQIIVDQVAPPDVDINAPLQLQVSALDYDTYKGLIGIGRIRRGSITANSAVRIIGPDGKRSNGRVLELLGFHGLQRTAVPKARAGDIIAFTGLEKLHISDTLCDPEHVQALPPLVVDEPTVTMFFQANTSPFAGREGKFLTSRQIHERLQRELLHNVALRVEETGDADTFRVSGRGELHLSILIETMRREGYELAVSRPEVITKIIDGCLHEPYEYLTVDIEAIHQGAVMEKLGERKGELEDMLPDSQSRVRLDYTIPARGLIGFRTEFLTATQGTGLLHHVFDHYGPARNGVIGQRNNGVMISNGSGKSLGYSLFNLQERGRLFIGPGEEIYEGRIIGIHSRTNDLVVNPLKGKQLTNVRASGTDEAIDLTPPVRMTLEQALEFINDDELVEVTPQSIRLRKKHLLELDRKRARPKV
ncbi:MAG TPA: translational GTPase TypA [Gammaproteobacteria bacterium]|nr:translational GTPase TypA [Gammaproteobacteria bacterium]